eukprot:SAG11_NODE_27091_length_337_cov_0.647059_2_plen_50_part_01
MSVAPAALRRLCLPVCTLVNADALVVPWWRRWEDVLPTVELCMNTASLRL